MTNDIVLLDQFLVYLSIYIGGSLSEGTCDLPPFWYSDLLKVFEVGQLLVFVFVINILEKKLYLDGTF